MNKKEYIKQMVINNRIDVEKLYFLRPKRLEIIKKHFIEWKTAYKIHQETKKTKQAVYYLLKPIKKELYSFFKHFFSEQ